MTPLHRLITNWVYGGTLAGVLLLTLTPILTQGWPLSATLVFLTLPAYMFHQWEEHDADRFRQFVNREIANGKEALTLADVFVINVVFVWFLLAAVLWLIRAAHPGWGLIAAWLVLINGAAHAGLAIAMRKPNPGLYSGTILFLPLGAAALITTAPLATLLQHILSPLIVIALHAAILIKVAHARKAPPGKTPL